MIYDKDIASKVAEYLLEIKAIRLNPKDLFTWASGKKSPIYCDNRVSLAYPEARTFIKNSFASLVKDKFNGVDMIAGVATAGISHGALLADVLELPFCYVRSKAKEHGTKSLIEGKLSEGDKVVVVEDLFSTGGSAIKAIHSLRSEGAVILGAVAIFNYGFPRVDEAFKEIDATYFTLSNFESLLDSLKQRNDYPADDIQFMMDWYRKG